jgi:hypothetical protein
MIWSGTTSFLLPRGDRRLTEVKLLTLPIKTPWRLMPASGFELLCQDEDGRSKNGLRRA